MTIEYIVTIDRNDDGDFADDAEPISPDLISLEWRLGMNNPFESIAAPSYGKITLRNTDRAFSPENNALLPGQRLTIESDDGTTVRTHFTGYIDHVEPSAGDEGKRIAVIHVRGLLDQLQTNRVRLPPQINVTADAVIETILLASRIRYRALDGYCVIGVDGYNLIGTHKLFGAFDGYNLETGKSTFAYVGDTWGEGVAADEAISQLAASERGRFYEDRDGDGVFINRHHTIVDVDSVASFADDMEGLIYRYGADVVNHVEVAIRPRTIGAANSELWSLTAVQSLPPNGVQRIVARYRDDNDNPLGAIQVNPLRADAGHYVVNTRADGSGANATASVRAVLIETGMSAAVIEVYNHSHATLYLQSLTVYGTPLIGGDPATLIHADPESATFYGFHKMTLDLPALTSLDEADQIARYELGRRKAPVGIVRALATSTRSHPDHVLALTLFDRVTVAETQTDHSAEYFIIAEDHRVDQGGTRHRVVWTLEPADSDRFFVVGTHYPDGSRVLAY